MAIELGDVRVMEKDIRSLREGEMVSIISIDHASVTVESIMTGHTEKVSYEYIAE